MPTLQNLREQRATIVNNARADFETAKARATAENRDLNTEEMAPFQKAMKDVDNLTQQIDAGEKDEQAASGFENWLSGAENTLKNLNKGQLRRVAGSGVPSDLLDPVNAQKDHALAVKGWFLNQYNDEIPQECIDAGKRIGLNVHAKDLVVNLRTTDEYAILQDRFRNAMSGAVPGAGGTLRFSDILGTLENAMLTFGPMLRVADVMRTETGNDIPWPTADDTGNIGEQVGEAASVGDAADPKTGAVIFGAYKFTSKVMKVSYELIQDSATNLPVQIGKWAGERLGRIYNRKATIGTGQATVKGIVPASVLGKQTASNSAFTADEWLALQHSVPDAYRAGAQFMFADATLLILRTLKSNDSQYIWQPGLQAGVPGTLLGSGYVINDDVPTLAASARIGIYGQLDKYKWRQVQETRIYRMEERYRDTDQDGFVAFGRADGNLLDAGAGPVRHLAMAN